WAVDTGAGGPVAGERTVLDCEGRAEHVGDAAPSADRANGLVVVHGHSGEDEIGPIIEDAAAQGDRAGEASEGGARGPAVGDGQVVDLDVGAAAADAEDSAGVVAADGQPALAGAVDGQVAGDVQLAAGQGDGPVQVVGEADGVGAGMGVGVQD